MSADTHRVLAALSIQGMKSCEKYMKPFLTISEERNTFLVTA